MTDLEKCKAKWDLLDSKGNLAKQNIAKINGCIYLFEENYNMLKECLNKFDYFNPRYCIAAAGI